MECCRREAEPAVGEVALSTSVSGAVISVAEGIALKTEESKGAGYGVVHLEDIQAIADLGSLLLIGMALAGLIAAPRRESRKTRAAGRIT